MSLATNLARIRRFLRDPDGTVWTDEQLRRLWNDAQAELAQKTGYLERVEAYRYPSRFTWVYWHDWERHHTDGDRLQALTYWQAQNAAICYPWEPMYWHDDGGPADDGYRVLQPWESAYGAPGDIVPVLFHARHHRTRYAAFDQEEIISRSRREVSDSDPWYRTRTGKPECYYPVDESERLFAIYPRPTSITWDDWEEADTFDDAGGILDFLEGTLDTGDVGLVQESIGLAGTLFMVFQATPTPIDEWTDDSDFPSHMLHYVEMGTLERAFGADTDGFIPSLRDYWGQRKRLAIEAVKRAKQARARDQVYRMRVLQPTNRTIGRAPAGHPGMPDGYPGWTV